MSGKELSQEILDNVKKHVQKLSKKPKLVVLQVGNNESSNSYIKRKMDAAAYTGIVVEHKIFKKVTQLELIKAIEKLNDDKSVSGILLQLPLPNGLDEKEIISHISIKKDVDGLNFVNVGALWSTSGDLTKSNNLFPCTALGIMELFKKYKVSLEGKKALVIGRSNIVGKPIAAMLLNSNAAVTIVHSKIKNLIDYTLSADIIVVAVGSKALIKANMVKINSVIVDVGINRTNAGVFGDVDQSIQKKVHLVSPVPGGVGPMTVAMLMANVLKAHNLKEKK